MRSSLLGLCALMIGVQPACAPKRSENPPAAQRANAEQEIVSLSGEKWRWMAERNMDSLGALFHDQAVFVHMGGTMSKSQELDVIRSGGIHYKNAEIEEAHGHVLFGDVWARPGLSQRDRSLVTVSALIAMNRPDQLRSHLARARDNGVTLEEVVETITHLAFYAGWPNAVTAVSVAREVFAEALR